MKQSIIELVASRWLNLRKDLFCDFGYIFGGRSTVTRLMLKKNKKITVMGKGFKKIELRMKSMTLYILVCFVNIAIQ